MNIDLDRISVYLKSSEEYLLNKIKSKYPKDLLINIHSFENMRFTWNKFKNEIKTYKPKYTYDELEKMIINQHETFFSKKRKKVIKEINQMLDYHIRGVNKAYDLYKNSNLDYYSDYIEFDESVLDSRDSIEYSYDILNKLGYEKTIEEVKEQLLKTDPLLQELSKKGTSQIWENDYDNKAPNSKLFPEHFWWRKNAWMSYIKHLKERDEEIKDLKSKV
jgi:hypothetical protein